MILNSYHVTLESGLYVARPIDGDDHKFVSKFLHRVEYVIDQFWDALDQMPKLHCEDLNRLTVSRRVRDWISNPTSELDLDDAHARGAL